MINSQAFNTLPQVLTYWAEVQPERKALADVADLEIPGQGRLKCRPVLPGATTGVYHPQYRHQSCSNAAVTIL